MNYTKNNIFYSIFGFFIGILTSNIGFSQKLDPIDPIIVTVQTEPDSIAFTSGRDSITVNAQSEMEDIVAFAKNYVGTPYRTGGVKPGGFDCSGFVYFIMGNFGVELNRSSASMAATHGKDVRLANVQPGDLLFFRSNNSGGGRVGHVSLVTEVNKDSIMMIHATNSKGIKVDNFKTSEYYQKRFIKAKRIDYDALRKEQEAKHAVKDEKLKESEENAGSAVKKTSTSKSKKKKRRR